MSLSKPIAFIDSFTTTLTDLPVSDKRDIRKVFDWMVANGRFSTFDIDNHLAKPVTELFRLGFLLDTDKLSYPWCNVVPTATGTAWRDGTIEVCQTCNGLGYVPALLTGHTAKMADCSGCDGSGFSAKAKEPTP